VYVDAYQFLSIFLIFFKVISAGSTSSIGGGPAGVTLTLYQDNKKLNETKSKGDGT
jgi:hypothetical protein